MDQCITMVSIYFVLKTCRETSFGLAVIVVSLLDICYQVIYRKNNKYQQTRKLYDGCMIENDRDCLVHPHLFGSRKNKKMGSPRMMQ